MGALVVKKGVFRMFKLRTMMHKLEEDTNAWLECLSKKGVKDLSILKAHNVQWSEMPLSIFKCRELSCLALGNFNLDVNGSNSGFSNLVSLPLYDCHIYHDILEQIISSCPLEMLFIDSCVFLTNGCDDRKTAISAPNLRVFNIVCHDQTV